MFTLKPKICAICQQEFMPESAHQKYCKNIHYRICPICGKSYPEPNLGKFKQSTATCSMECRVRKRTQTSLNKYGITAPGNNPKAREKAKQTMQERYGVDYAQESKEIRQKTVKTYIERYGEDNPQKCDAIKEKTKNTNIQKYGSVSYLNSGEGKTKIDKIMLDKYGTTTPLRNDKIKEKWIQTNIEKYGVENPAQSEEVKERSKSTSLIRYGTEYPQSSDIVKQHIREGFIRNYGVDNCFKSEEIIEKIKQNFYKKYGVHGVMQAPEIAEKIKATNIKKYGVPYGIMKPGARKSSGAVSEINRKISEKLKNIGIANQLEYTLNNYSYDIFIPQGNMFIEINPTYTHNVIGNHWNPKGVDKNYHLKKTLNAEQNGFRCIHLWDWDCESKFIQSLAAKHIVYTKAYPEIINKSEAEEFIHKYGLYEVTNNIPNLAFIGVRYKTKLIHLMGFRQIEPILNIWELVCIENRFNYVIHNGLQELLEEFIYQYNPSKIISYADFSKTNGESLEALGFEYTKFILPTKIWSKGRHAIIDNSLIIPEAMLLEHWLPVYNCGYKVYEKHICTPKIFNMN